MTIFIICYGLALLGLSVLWIWLLVKMDEMDRRLSEIHWTVVLDREFDEEEDE